MGFQNSMVFLERETIHVEKKGWKILGNIRSRNTNELCSVLFIQPFSRKYRDSSVCEGETPVDGIERDVSRGFISNEKLHFPRILRMRAQRQFHPTKMVDYAGVEETHRHRGNDQNILRFPSKFHKHQEFLPFQVFQFGGEIGVAGVSAVNRKDASTSPPNPGQFSRLGFKRVVAQAPRHSDSRGRCLFEPPVLRVGGNPD